MLPDSSGSNGPGFEGAPKTGLLNAQMPIAKIGSEVGLSVYFDELGQQKSNFARLSYSFHRKIGPGTFGVGLSAGLLAHSLGSNWIARDNPADDAAIQGMDSPTPSSITGGWFVLHQSNLLYQDRAARTSTEPELKDVSIKGYGTVGCKLVTIGP
ncbi:MAG: type IX secretion system membrane protein PorP/SprF [Flavobacteriales bacterium]|nr:type IX secretion system membrane protein PorP/SprF [Flavobacteriales bacterium]